MGLGRDLNLMINRGAGGDRNNNWLLVKAN